MSRPKLLDGFCGGGGAGYGYHLAGFEVVGVDNRPQPRYPFELVQADFFEYVAEHGDEYDVIHASPPCQFYSRLRSMRPEAQYQELIVSTRVALQASGKVYVIENVEDALSFMRHPIRLCGSSFGLDVRRHRLFESNVLVFAVHCNHSWQTPRFPALRSNLVAAGHQASVVGVYGHGHGNDLERWRKAMDIEWMKKAELAQAIPPAYTEYIGNQIMLHLESEEYAKA